MIQVALALGTTLLYGVYFLPITLGIAVVVWAVRRFFEELEAPCR